MAAPKFQLQRPPRRTRRAVEERPDAGCGQPVHRPSNQPVQCGEGGQAARAVVIKVRLPRRGVKTPPSSG